MKIVVNGKEVLLEKPISIQELLTIQKVQMPQFVTVQVNNEILNKYDHDKYILKENDEIEFLYFMGGGGL